MDQYFPQELVQTQLVLYIRSVDGSTVLQPEVDTFSLAFNHSCRALAEPGFVEGVEGYYLFKHMGLPDKALAPFVSPDGMATMIVVTINALVVGKPGALLPVDPAWVLRAGPATADAQHVRPPVCVYRQHKRMRRR